ncbi:RagB/SusD family nutrient uptake outer membrane protein [Flammeovirga pectinis]|uniref:RagB/SusD family nutrient uptake outer membrane protein n=1 Tax=Flammeovirga pectinis TaxID=2494373 RepID=A0A3S9P867_9BACT|nr:RagB/SusD family nutrient uptake outer membrane protein [Flammeovirga pectinis]AZQ64344.1 RagB/SusD family nutrient uptake outer membrane protein [Flammeovirga pectinis]
MKLYKILVGAALVGAMSSCTLDVEPQQNVDIENIETVQPSDLIGGLYNRMQELGYYGRNFNLYGDIGTDLVSAGPNDGGRFQDHYNLRKNFTTVGADTGTEDDKNTFDAIYEVISNANLILQTEGLDLDDSEVKNAIGQAHFIRAFAYSDLLKSFGNVPLVVTAPTTVEEAVAQKPELNDRSDIFAQVYADLDNAAKYISNTTKINATVDAVKALRVRVLLFEVELNSSKATANADEIITIANELAGTYVLTPIDKLFDYYQGEGGVETIFELKFASNQGRGSNNYGNIYGAPEAGMYGAYLASPLLFHAHPDTVLLGGVVNDARFESSEEVGKTLIYESEDTDGSTLHWIMKYYSHDNTIGLTSPKLLRYAEVLLAKAEAHLLKGETALAAEAINKLRRNRIQNYTDVTTVTLQDVWNETAKEFAFEGHRMWDLRRTNQKVIVSDRKGVEIATEDPAVDGGVNNGGQQTWFPIPEREMLANPSIPVNNWGY